MPNYPYTFQLPPLNVQDIPNDGVVGEFLGISAGGVLDWLPVSGGSGTGDLLAANNLSELTNFATARTNIGLGTASTPTFANLTLTSPSLSSSAPVTISQTWNAGSNVMTALKVVATDTASGATSNLLELWAGSTPALKVRVNKTGTSFFNANGSNTDPVLRIGAGANINGWYSFGGVQLNAVINSANAFGISASGTNIAIGNLAFGGSADVVLERDGAANTLALRNSTAAQTFNVYGTWTTAITNFERLAIKYNTTDVAYQIAAEKGTTNGDYRPLQLWTGGASRLHITTAGNVGIGTTAPVATLHVNGADVDQDTKRVALFQSNDTNINGNFSVVGITSADLVVNTFDHRLLDLDFAGAGSASTGTYIRMLRGGVERAGIGLASDEFVITTGATEKLRVTAAGNVGIGTTLPTSKLHVDGNALFGQNTNLPTLTPLKVSFGGTYGTSTAGSRANLKWEMYNDGLAANLFGIGMSLGLMEFQAGNGSGFAFYPNNSLTSALTISPSGAATFANNVFLGGYIQISNADGRISFDGGNKVFYTAANTYIQDLYRRAGSGDPNGTVTAPVGATYNRTDGGAGTSFYVKESGTGNTGWVGK